MRYSIVGQRIFLLFVLNCRQFVLPLQKEMLKLQFREYEEELLQMREQGVRCAAHYVGLYGSYHVGIVLWSYA